MAEVQTNPELRVLEALEIERPAHWSAVARQMHIRPSSAQQYLSRLVRAGRARRVSAGWYVRTGGPTQPLWQTTKRLREVYACAKSLTAGWDSAQFRAYMTTTNDMPDFVYVAVPKGALSDVYESLSAKYAVHTEQLGTDAIDSSSGFAVLLRVSSERSGRDMTDLPLADPDRALVDLCIESARGRISLAAEGLEEIARTLFEARMIRISKMRRYAMRRYEKDAVLAVLRTALPDAQSKALRGVLNS